MRRWVAVCCALFYGALGATALRADVCDAARKKLAKPFSFAEARIEYQYLKADNPAEKCVEDGWKILNDTRTKAMRELEAGKTAINDSPIAREHFIKAITIDPSLLEAAERLAKLADPFNKPRELKKLGLRSDALAAL